MQKFTRISVSQHTEWFYNFFAATGINRTRLLRNESGEFETPYIQTWRLALFILNRLNVSLKILYLVLLYNGCFTEQEPDFYTKYGIWIWVWTAVVTIYSDYYYMSKYPCFETLIALWNVESEIYFLLSKHGREKFRKRLDVGAKHRTGEHM